MRTTIVILTAVVLAASGTVLAGEDANATKVIEKTVKLPGGGQIHVRCETSGEGNASAVGLAAGPGGTITVTAGQDKEGECEQGEVAPPDPNAAWLGIRVGPVPAAVAAQLGLKDAGVMVRNIVKGSPADKAGLERYDVLVAVGKQALSGDVGKFIEAVQAHKPGEKVELTVIRAGRKKPLAVTLGKPQAGKAEMVHEEGQDEAWQDELKLHRGMIRKAPGGGWVVIGPEGGKMELPGEIVKALGKGAWSGMQVKVGSAGEGKVQFDVRKTTDGRAIQVESTKDGGIRVTRMETDKQGKESGKAVKEYKTADELKAGDAEAYELYKSVAGKGAAPKGWTFGPSVGQWKGKIAQIVVPKELSAEARRQLAEMAENAKHAAREADEAALAAAAKAKQEAAAARVAVAKAIAPEPTAEFTMDADGRITVKVRDADTAATLTFTSESDLKTRAPKLYERYRKLVGKGG